MASRKLNLKRLHCETIKGLSYLNLFVISITPVFWIHGLYRCSSGLMSRASVICWRQNQLRTLGTEWSRSSTASLVSLLKPM